MPITQTIAAENHADVEQLIFHNVHKFIAQVMKRKRYITSAEYEFYFHEAVSEANFAFMQACQGYDPSKAAFSTWVTNSIHYRLLDWWDATVRQSERFRTNMDNPHRNNDDDWFADVPDEGNDLDDSIKERKRFIVEDFLGKLSDDAQTVAKLILDDSAMPDVWDWHWHSKEWREQVGLPERMHCARKAVKQRLLDWGWTTDMVRDSWQEIMDVLCRERLIYFHCRRCKNETANAGRICTRCLT